MNPTIFFLLLGLNGALDEVVEAEKCIRAEDLRAHVYFLASDELQGREAGTENAVLASRYLADTLESYGVKPANPDGSFFQPFEKEEKKMRNVVGWIEGSDPVLKQEFVALGAHYDHVGWGGKRSSLSTEHAIHNGADDNASGTATLLELAQAFAKKPPKRSVLILHFTGEEKGLWGSEYYCNHPLRPLDKTVAMLNFDMVGRSVDHYLFVGGTGTGEGFESLLKETAKQTPLHLETGSGGKAPSDNENFFDENIPSLFFFTNIHDDYHAPGDDWWKINYADQEWITRYVFRFATVLGDEAKRREFHFDSEMGVPEDFESRMKTLIKKLLEKEMAEEEKAEEKKDR